MTKFCGIANRGRALWGCAASLGDVGDDFCERAGEGHAPRPAVGTLAVIGVYELFSAPEQYRGRMVAVRGRYDGSLQGSCRRGCFAVADADGARRSTSSTPHTR